MPVRITVIRGKCQGNIHEIGQEFIVDHTTPEGICLDAWHAISPYVTALLHGGNFPWEKKKGITRIHCPDSKGIEIEIKRVR